MSTPYPKPWKNLDEQVAILKGRGMTVPDDEVAKTYLARFNYYRLSAYWYPHRIRNLSNGRLGDDFKPGTNFVDIVATYEFDQGLREIIFRALDTLETALRARISYVLGEHHPEAYRLVGYLDHNFTAIGEMGEQSTHQEWLRILNNEVKRSKEDFVKHIRKDLGCHLPVWAVLEVTSFGGLTKLLSGLKADDQKKIAHWFNFVNANGQDLSSTLTPVFRGLNTIRNVCGHHGRLWNRTISEHMPRVRLKTIPELMCLDNPTIPKNRIFETLAVLMFLDQQITGTASLTARLRSHLGTLPAIHTLAEMGFPAGWEQHPVWAAAP